MSGRSSGALFVKGADVRIVGVVATVPAPEDAMTYRPRADGDFEPDYDGTGVIHWGGGARAELTAEGRWQYVGSDGRTYDVADLELRADVPG